MMMMMMMMMMMSTGTLLWAFHTIQPSSSLYFWFFGDIIEVLRVTSV